MKVTMRLTLDGLVRAMRVTAHELAEAVERGEADSGRGPSRREREADARRGDDHDRSSA